MFTRDSFSLFISILLIQPTFGQIQQNTTVSTPVLAVNDTLTIQVANKPSFGELVSVDDFDNTYSFSKGSNQIRVLSVVTDVLWQRQTNFVLFKKFGPIEFVNESSFWLAKTSDEKQTKELNFEVYYRKELSPITDPIKSGVFRFLAPAYILNDKKREKDIDDYFTKKSDYLQKYYTKNALSSDFLHTWQDLIKFEKLSYKLYMGTNYAKFNKNYLIELSRHTDVFKNDTCLYLPHYRRAVWGMLDMLTYLLYRTDQGNLNQYATSIEKYFTGKTKDYLMGVLLLRAKIKMYHIAYTPQDYNALLNKFIETSQTPEYTDYLKKNRAVSTAVIKPESLIKSDGTQASLLELVKKKKLTYIDFWASWCAPCRAEMPNSKKLQEDYKDKNINFIYLSIDTDPAAWGLAMKQLSLSPQGSFLLDKGNKSSLALTYKVSAIPRYMILDQEGKLINGDAPRPGDPALKKILDNLLR